MRWLGPFFIFFLLFAGWATWYVTEPGHPDPAAWVQAIWSVVAVILAVLAPMWHAEVQARAEYRRQRKLLAEIVNSADSLIQTAGKAADVNDATLEFHSSYQLAEFEAVRDALGGFPITALHHEQEVRQLMQLRALMGEVVNLLVIGERAWAKDVLHGIIEFQASLGRIHKLGQTAEAALHALKAKS